MNCPYIFYQLEEELTETLSVEYTDGLVTNYWIEEDRF